MVSTGLNKKATDITATPGSIEEFKLLKGRMPSSEQELNEFTASRRAAERKPEEGTKPTKLTIEDRRDLIGTNLTDEMISNIEEGVRTIGIDKVLEDNYTDDQKKAIQKVYGKKIKEVTSSQILAAAQAMGIKDVENFFRARFTEDELKTFAKEAGFAGFFTRKTKEISNYLSSPKAREKLSELLKEQYKQQGYTIK